MDKKHDLPAMPFYFGDWRKAPEIRALDLDVRMIWFEMLGFMWESTERGYLTINGNSVSDSVISKMIGVDRQVLDHALKQMEEFNIFSRRESDNAIYCRKMVRDERLRRKKSKAGKKGMSVRYSVITPDTAGDITNSENESESEDESVSVEEKESFEKFWDLYDYKVGKDDCWAYWSGSKRLKSGFKLTVEDKDKIMDVVSDYVRATNKDGVFPARKHPKTWLYNSGWQDEIPQPKRTTGFTRAEVYGNRKQYEEWDERTG